MLTHVLRSRQTWPGCYTVPEGDSQCRNCHHPRLRGEWAQKLDERHRMLQSPPRPSLRGAKSFHTPDKMAA